MVTTENRNPYLFESVAGIYPEHDQYSFQQKLETGEITFLTEGDLFDKVCGRVFRLIRPSCLDYRWQRKNDNLMEMFIDEEEGIKVEEVLLIDKTGKIYLAWQINDGVKIEISRVWKEFNSVDADLEEKPVVWARKYQPKFDLMTDVHTDNYLSLLPGELLVDNEIKSDELDGNKVLLVDCKNYQQQGYPYLGALQAVTTLSSEIEITYLPFAMERKERDLLEFKKEEDDFIIDVCHEVMDKKPKVVFLPGFDIYLTRIGRVIRAIKKISPETKVVVGGPAFTALAVNDGLSSSDDGYPASPFELFYNQETGKPDLDVMVVGEGSQITPHLLKALVNNDRQALRKLRGIQYFDQDSGQIIANPGHDILLAQDIPVVDYDRFIWHSRSTWLDPSAAGIFLTSACPKRCKFCIDHQLGNRFPQALYMEKTKTYQPVSAERFVADFFDNLDRGKTRFFLHASSADLYPYWKEVSNLIDEAISDPVRTNQLKQLESITLYARVDGLMRNSFQFLDLISKLVAGDNSKLTIAVGIESTVPEVLDRVDKGVKASSQEIVLKELKKRGINCRINIIIGLDGETPDQAEETVNSALRYKSSGLVQAVDPHNAEVIYTQLVAYFIEKGYRGVRLQQELAKYLLNLGMWDMPKQALVEAVSTGALSIDWHWGAFNAHTLTEILAEDDTLGLSLNQIPAVNYGRSCLNWQQMAGLINRLRKRSRRLEKIVSS